MMEKLLNYLQTHHVGNYTLTEIIVVAVLAILVIYIILRILCFFCGCCKSVAQKAHDHNHHLHPASDPDAMLAAADARRTIIQPPPALQPIPTASDWQDSNVVPTGSEQILVIDDEKIVRDVNHRILSNLGYQVDSVASGPEAVDWLRKNDADLLLLDLIMPGVDGVETFRQIKQFKPSQKCVVLSAYPRYNKIHELQALGCGPYLVKPPSLAATAGE